MANISELQGMGIQTIDVSQTTAKKKDRSLIGGAAEFLAPTTVKTFDKLKSGEAPTLRELGGSALEIGSFAIPSGAILRGLGVAGRASRFLTGAGKVAPKAEEVTDTAQKARNLITQTKEASKIGGATGAAASGGRALGDEDKTLVEVVGETAIGTGAGVVGGALFAPVASLATASSKAIASQTSNAFRTTKNLLDPSDRASVVDELANNLVESFVEDNRTVTKNLEKIAIRRSRKGQRLTEQDLVREIVDEGYIPNVDGKLARFRGSIEDLESRQVNLAKGVDKVLEPFEKETTSLADLKVKSIESLQDRFDVDINKATRQVDQLFGGLERKYGKNPTPQQMNRIRIEMNAATKSFNKDQFVLDAATAVGNAARARLDEITPAVRQLNAEYGRLQTIREAMAVLDNRPIDVGTLSSATGRFLGTIGGAGLGITVAGPGGLVVAGVLANLGQKGAANMIRSLRFNKAAQELIKTGLRRDEELLKKLLKGGSPADRRVIQRAAGVQGKSLSGDVEFVPEPSRGVQTTPQRSLTDIEF